MAIPLVGRNVAVAVDGYDFTGNGNEIKLKRDAAKIGRHRVRTALQLRPGRIQKASLELKGFYSYGYSQIDQIIKPAVRPDQTTSRVGCTGGYPVLGPAILMPSVITKYDLDAKLKGAIDLDAEFDARGRAGQGFILKLANRDDHHHRQLHGPVHRWGGHRRGDHRRRRRARPRIRSHRHHAELHGEDPAFPGRHHLDRPADLRRDHHRQLESAA